MSSTVCAEKNKESFEIVETFLANSYSPIFQLRFHCLMICLFLSVPQIYLETAQFSCFKRNGENMVLKVKIG